MSKYNNVNFHKVTASTDQDFIEKKLIDDNEKLNFNYKQFLGLMLGLTHYIIAGITSGYASVFIVQASDTEGLKITKSEASWIASIVVVPMAPAGLLCGFLLNKIRKKTVLIIITLFEILAWVIMYGSTSVTGILIGRALSGIASAMGSPIIPPYLAEISHPNMRGLYLCMVLLGISLGLLVIHVLGAFFTWNMCALITALILVVYFCLVLYLNETYAWYLRNDNIEETKKAFCWYRGKSACSMLELEKLLAKRHENASNNYTKKQILHLCLSKLLLMPLAISTVGMLTMHLSGMKPIMFYSISIVSQVIPSLDQYTSTIVVDIIRIFMTCVGCVLINKFPVRPLFIISGIGSAISHFCFAAFFSYTVNSVDQTYPILALIALISYTAFSSIGIAPLAWIIAGEIFPFILKGIASGMCCFVYFFSFFIIVKITPEMFDAFGIAGGFVIFGGCTLWGTITMYFILPETKNKTLKEIEDLFR